MNLNSKYNKYLQSHKSTNCHQHENNNAQCPLRSPMEATCFPKLYLTDLEGVIQSLQLNLYQQLQFFEKFAVVLYYIHKLNMVL